MLKGIPSYSKTSDPLINLTRPGVDFNWTDDCTTAFKKINHELLSVPWQFSANMEDISSGMWHTNVVSEIEKQCKIKGLRPEGILRFSVHQTRDYNIYIALKGNRGPFMRFIADYRNVNVVSNVHF